MQKLNNWMELLVELDTALLDMAIESNKKLDERTPEEAVIKVSDYTFNNLLGWDHQLNAWAKAFKKQHGFFPNILLASSGTYSWIDLVVNARGKENLHNPQGEKPPEEEFISMKGFRGQGYELDFCIKEDLGLDTVKLIYDSDPNGGLPIPENEEEQLDKELAC